MNSINFTEEWLLYIYCNDGSTVLAKKAVENGKRYNELMDAHLKQNSSIFALSLDALGITFLNEEIYFHIIFSILFAQSFLI